MDKAESKTHLVYLRHTEKGVQVGRDRIFASRFLRKDPNAEVIMYSCTMAEARAAAHIAIQTLKFAGLLAEI